MLAVSTLALCCAAGVMDAKTVPYAWVSSPVLFVAFDADMQSCFSSQLDNDLPENCIMGHENVALFCPYNCLIKALYSNYI